MRAWQAPLWLKALFGLCLAPIWGGTPTGYTTYFSSDSTPLFIMLVAALARRQPGLLDEPVARIDGRSMTLRDSVAEACGWIERHLNDDGLVEVGQSNPLALQQVWKDGPTSNFDERGHMPNVVRPMAYLDVQVLAAEALARAADLQVGRPGERLRAESRAIRDATIAHFWLPERRYFGHAIDRDPDGRHRLLRSVQSNAGWMLATSFFDDLPETQRAALVGGIVRMLFSAELLTPAGIRGRGLADHNPHFRNYHENVWPVETAAIARGLRRQGLDELAEQLEARLLNVANMLGGIFEFVTVDPRAGCSIRVLRPTARRACSAGPCRACRPRWSPMSRWAGRRPRCLPIKRDRAARARAGRTVAERLAARPAWLADLTARCCRRAHRSRSARHGPSSRSATSSWRRPISTTPRPATLGRHRARPGFGGVLRRELGRRVRDQACRCDVPGVGRPGGARTPRSTARAAPTVATALSLSRGPPGDQARTAASHSRRLHYRDHRRDAGLVAPAGNRGGESRRGDGSGARTRIVKSGPAKLGLGSRRHWPRGPARWSPRVWHCSSSSRSCRASPRPTRCPRRALRRRLPGPSWST